MEATDKKAVLDALFGVLGIKLVQVFACAHCDWRHEAPDMSDTTAEVVMTHAASHILQNK